MVIEENKLLTEYTTFQVSVYADYFVILHSEEELYQLMQSDVWKNNKRYILGEGSNILFTQDFKGLVVVNALKGFSIVSEDTDSLVINVASGENWHDFVLWSVEKELWGIENLALIPGTVGAAPVQNIGAYGVEVEETIISVDTILLESHLKKNISHDKCNFGYRNSIFKQQPDTYFVASVQFKLSKKPQPRLSYGVIMDTLETQGNKNNITPKNISTAIVSIRNSKLPRVGEIGMAGSFFKNPIITKEHGEKIQEKYPHLKYFPLDNNLVKIPAGWIIEELGYKGVHLGNVGTYEKHALVLVNYGEATGSEVWNFAQKIISETQSNFDITLEPEVIII